MGSSLDVGHPEMIKSVARLLFVDIAPEILAREREGMTSEYFPRISVPLSLTIHPGAVLPDLPLLSEARPGTRWGVAATVALTASLGFALSENPASPTWPQSCQTHVRKPLRSQRGPGEPLSVSVRKRRVSRHEPTCPSISDQSKTHSGPDCTVLTIPVSSSFLQWPVTNLMAPSVMWSPQYFISTIVLGFSNTVVFASSQACMVCWMCEARTRVALMGSGTVEVSRSLLLSWWWSLLFFLPEEDTETS